MTLTVGDKLAKVIAAPTTSGNLTPVKGEVQHIFEVERIDYLDAEGERGWHKLIVKLKVVE